MKLPANFDAAEARSAVTRELCRRSFSYFVKHCWSEVEPAVPLRWGFHLDALSAHLEACYRREIRNLLIAMPPRSAKSLFVSVFFPAWVWLVNPQERFLTASYGQNLVTRDALRTRRLMQSEVYQALAPDFCFAGDQNQKMRYENNRKAWRIALTPGTGTTGEGGNFRIVDDLHNVRDVESTDIREGTVNWFFESFTSRKVEPSTDIQIVMAQRTHEADVSGEILRRQPERWDYLCLPTEYESAYSVPATSLGFTDPRTAEGELLCPTHLGPKEVADVKQDLGSWAYEAQHQQRPSGLRGTILPIDQLQRFASLPLRFDLEVMSWDFAFKGKSEKLEKQKITDPSYVVGQRWGVIGGGAAARYYLLDSVRGQWGLLRSIEAFKAFCEKHNHIRTKLVENKANGPAVEDAVKAEIGKIDLVEPSGSKIQRAQACQSLFEYSQIYVPDRAPWLDAWIDEVRRFPFATHDDQVDCTTQALNYFLMKTGKARARLLKLVTR